MSGGREIVSLPSTVVCITADDGTQGFGETCPLGPAYLPAHGGGARAALRELGPALLGLDPCALATVNDALDTALLGHAYAKSAVDVACWDLLGKATGQPVCTLLGGRRQATFPLYIAVPLGPAEEMAAYVQARRAEGIHQFQLKLGADPHDDAARVRSGARGDDGRGRRDRGCERRLAAAGRRRRRTPAGRARPRLLRAAVPDARGMPLRTAADDAADGARRGDHRCLRAPASLSRGRHGGRQPQDLQGRRSHACAPDARARRDPRPQVDDRGHLGRRSRDRGREPSRSQRAARGALHRVVHERLDERAHRGVPAALPRRRRGCAGRPRPGRRGRSGDARRAALQLRAPELLRA